VRSRTPLLVAFIAVCVALVPRAEAGPTLQRLDVPKDLRVLSYFPADAGWTKMWTDWEPGLIDADLGRAAALHANTVRAIVQPDLFGYPSPSEKYTSRLAEFVALAAAHGLHVQLTLFDWWYRWDDVAGSETWARELLEPYVNDPRIAFVELRNELLPQPHVVAWARTLIPYLRFVLGGQTPVTLSVLGVDSTLGLRTLARRLGSVRPDFWDIHYFGGGAEVMYHVLRHAKSVAGGLPLWVGETGYPTTLSGSGYGGVPLTESAQEAAQAHFFETASWAARAAGLPRVGVWTLGDFVPAAVPDRVATPLDPELHFGLYHVDGSSKPAADVVRAAFSGHVPVSFNGGFETAVTSASGGSVPAQWSMTGDASFVEDTTVAKEGGVSVRVTPRRTDAVESLSIVPANAGVRLRTRIAVHAWSERTTGAGDVSLVVEWVDGSNRVLRYASSAALSTTARWGRLSVVALAPRRAAYVRVDLVVRGTTGPVWFDGVSFRRG
jgi:hypothetical protein